MILCPSWSFLLVRAPSVGFSSIIVSGRFSVSRGMRLWETDLPNLFDFRWCLCMDFFQLCKTKKNIWSPRGSSRNNVVSEVVHPDNFHGRVSSSHALWIIQKVIQHSVSFWWSWKCTAWIIEFFGSDQESTYMYIFLMTSLVMEWCVCDGWASCLRIL